MVKEISEGQIVDQSPKTPPYVEKFSGWILHLLHQLRKESRGCLKDRLKRIRRTAEMQLKLKTETPNLSFDKNHQCYYLVSHIKIFESFERGEMWYGSHGQIQPTI